MTPDCVHDLCRMLSSEEANDETVRSQAWSWSDLPDDWTFAVLGFVKLGGRRRGKDLFSIEEGPWSRGGWGDERFVNMRDPGVHHNHDGRPFVSVPIATFIDRFACFGLGGTSQVRCCRRRGSEQTVIS